MESMTMLEFATWWTCMLVMIWCIAQLYFTHQSTKDLQLDLSVGYRLDKDGDVVLDNGTLPLKLIKADDAKYMSLPRYPFGTLKIEFSSHEIYYYRHPSKRSVSVFISGTGWMMNYLPFKTAGHIMMAVSPTLAKLMRLDNSKKVNYRVLVFMERDAAADAAKMHKAATAVMNSLEEKK